MIDYLYVQKTRFKPGWQIRVPSVVGDYTHSGFPSAALAGWAADVAVQFLALKGLRGFKISPLNFPDRTFNPAAHVGPRLRDWVNARLTS